MQGTPLTRLDEVESKLDTLESSLTSMEARVESVEQVRNGQVHQRVFDPDSTRLLGDILEELKKMNFQLSIITCEENP